MSEAVVHAVGLSKRFPVPSRKIGEKAKEIVAVDNVDITIGHAAIFGVVGESGCGKTTLGRLLVRMEGVSSGKILFKGRDIARVAGKGLTQLRRQMQMIFQNPYGSFDPKQRIGAALSEVARVHKIPKAQSEQSVASLLSEVGMPADALARVPSELSGGQLQRLALARSLLLSPEFIVADEPVSALDVSVQAQILNLLLDLRDRRSLAMLFISHEMPVVKAVCDEVAVMYLGSVVESAPTDELFSHSEHPYTQALMSAVPVLDQSAAKKRIILEGDIASAMELGPGCPFAPRCRFALKRCHQEKPALAGQSGHLAACHLLAG
jgi:peptide/nickel transport system ATP-binding protein/oligopeptide transport system ATP-binding protein